MALDRGTPLSEYLVDIGWANNEEQMNGVLKVIAGTYDKIDNFAKNTAKGWVNAAKLVAGAYLAIAKKAADLLQEEAKLDLENQMLAKKYMVSANAMMAYNNALKELGMSYEDLFYATDEVRGRFNELVLLGRQMEAPEGLEDTMVLVRDIGFQFTKLNVILANLRRWVAYFMGQRMNGQLQRLRDTAASFIEYIQEHGVEVAEKVATVAAAVLNVFTSIAGVTIKLITYAVKFLAWIEKVAPWLKWILFIVWAYYTPIGKIAALIGLITALINDYQKALNKEETIFSWKQLYLFIKPVVEAVKLLVRALSNVFNTDWSQSPFMLTVKALAGMLRGILDTINLITYGIGALFGDEESIENFKYSAHDFHDLISDFVGGYEGNNINQSNVVDYIKGGGPNYGGYFSPIPTNTTNNDVKSSINITNNVKSVQEAKSLTEKQIQDYREGVGFSYSPVF